MSALNKDPPDSDKSWNRAAWINCNRIYTDDLPVEVQRERAQLLQPPVAYLELFPLSNISVELFIEVAIPFLAEKQPSELLFSDEEPAVIDLQTLIKHGLPSLEHQIVLERDLGQQWFDGILKSARIAGIESFRINLTNQHALFLRT